LGRAGYPDGFAGPQINDLVRFVTICDVYAALIERRSYRQAMEPARAFKILQKMERPRSTFHSSEKLISSASQGICNVPHSEVKPAAN